MEIVCLRNNLNRETESVEHLHENQKLNAVQMGGG
jgi:hypothetical protein